MSHVKNAVNVAQRDSFKYERAFHGISAEQGINGRYSVLGVKVKVFTDGLYLYNPCQFKV